MRHGTYSTYKNHKCRCEPCREAAREYERGRHRRRRNPTEAPSYSSERLRVTCWCGRKILKVAKAEVQAGRTASCGALHCHEGRAA